MLEQIQVQKGRYEKFAQILEEEKGRQIKGCYAGVNGGYCALGVILKSFGYDWYTPDHPLWNEGGPSEFLHKQFGNRDMYNEIVTRNDEGWSFKQIADWLRTQ